MKNTSILIVEDSQDMVELEKLLLENEGYSVQVASSGSEGLSVMANSPEFSLILLDHWLPDMKADEFISKKNECGLNIRTPVILCSAASDLKQLEPPEGVVGLLAKPFQVADFLSMVKNSSQMTEGNSLNLGQDI